MRAVVTGASSGIGQELARLLNRNGYELTLVARSADALDQLAAEFGGATVVAVDLADPESIGTVVSSTPEADVLVNCAGFGEFGAFADTDPARLDSMVALNVRALTDLTRAYLPGMLERKRGRVLNVASTASFQPGPLMATYFATKAYVLSLSEALHEETRGTGVSVTALCPGPTASGFQSAANLVGSKLFAGRKLPTSRSVAKFGYRAMCKGRAVAVPGVRNKVLAGSIRIMPRPIVRRLIKRAQELT